RGSIQSVRTAISLWVLGVVSKAHTTSRLRRVVAAAKNGHLFVPGDLARSVIGRAPPLRITPAEETVLQLLADGHTVTKISEVLDKSTGTISCQKHTAMHKLGLGTWTELYALLST
ncbi:LuxR C-terminal-related transcriptional regulator, partial [Mesorhizobium sp. M8A.F.Ca.ET.142.01.1.1]|uniref:LuxR C-terminal-related transcriptional regulator n=1 Tax=Mesorhizobium sp. M8A.F.Ca.ET.142.01.1.1 TaxID=2563958 RepID=UPI00109409E0